MVSSGGIVRLTKPQKRHLREMLNDKGETRYWHPWGSAEWSCAHTLVRKGLLTGNAHERGGGYWLSDIGLEVARGL